MSNTKLRLHARAGTAPSRGDGRRTSASRARVELGACLRARRGEIEHAALNRIDSISDPSGGHDPAYRQGLRTALSAALDYAVVAVEHGEEGVPPPPPALLGQARLAARHGVGIDTVLRRYLAGYTLLADFLVEEAERQAFRGEALKRVLRAQSAVFDRLLAAISEEYSRELNARCATTESRRVERIERLLAGELLDTSDLGYEFRYYHLGLLASGNGAEQTIRQLASGVDARLLMAQRDDETVWAWLGARRKLDWADFLGSVSDLPRCVRLAIGEPAKGIAGWRLTHRQAKAALPIALRSSERAVRYADVALLASALQDDLLVASLRHFYLAPLESERDGGKALRETLRVYFTAEGNSASAAAALGVTRQTINNRLRVVEERLGRPPGACGSELVLALALETLGRASDGEGHSAEGFVDFPDVKPRGQRLYESHRRSIAPAGTLI